MTEDFTARTVCKADFYLTSDALEAFALNSEAHYIWIYAMMRANTGWIFRKTHVMSKYVGCGERKWKEAIKFLMSLGLLDIEIVRGKSGQNFNSVSSIHSPR